MDNKDLPAFPKLKDCLHFYLGCEVEVRRKNCKNTHTGRICEVSKNSNHGDWIEVMFPEVVGVEARTFAGISYSNMHNYFLSDDSIKLLLRPLSSMTEEEIQTCGNMIYDFSSEPELNNHKWEDFTLMLMPEQFLWLLSKGFDLLGLIDSGQAIEKK